MNCNVVIAMISLTFSPGESNPVVNDAMDVCILVNDQSRMSVLSRQNPSLKSSGSFFLSKRHFVSRPVAGLR